MKIISVDDARVIANSYLLELEPQLGAPLQLADNQTIEKPFGWVFFYNSKEYLETGDFRSMLAGNAPFIVNKINGDLHVTGTEKPIQEYIADYEQQNSA